MTLIKRLHRVTLFPFLLPVFFVLHIARYYYGAVPALSVLEMGCLYVALSMGIYFILRYMLRRKSDATVITFMLVGLFLYWGKVLHYMLKAAHLSPEYRNYPFILAIYLMFVGISCWIVRKITPHIRAKTLFYFNTLFLCFILVEIGFLGAYAIITPHQKPLLAMDSREVQIDLQTKGGNSIYLLLFDEYTSSLSLKEDWGFDNRTMDSFLKDRGFFINDQSQSNYNMTYFSMASLLNMDYFNGFRQPGSLTDLPDYQHCLRAIEQSRVALILLKAGYTIENYSIFDLSDIPPKKEFRDYVISKRRLITVNTFYGFLERDYLPYFRYKLKAKKDPGYRDPTFYKVDDQNNQMTEMVTTAARRQASRPQFVYAHFMMPHPPYYYDSLDQIMPVNTIKHIPEDAIPRYYWYNVQHANNKLKQMVDTILKHDPAATIIVLGDHGYRLLDDATDHPEHFRNMSAVYFPDQNYSSIPDSTTNVNIFRIVLNKVCGTDYPLLENRCYTLTEPKD